MQIATTSPAYGISYVIADDPTQAYDKLKSYLDEHNLGFESERCLEKIELMADEEKYNDTGHMLFL